MHTYYKKKEGKKREKAPGHGVLQTCTPNSKPYKPYKPYTYIHFFLKKREKNAPGHGAIVVRVEALRYCAHL